MSKPPAAEPRCDGSTRRQHAAAGEPRLPDAAAPSEAVELLAELADARDAEQVVLTFLAGVRKELASAVLAARAAGVGYDRMAQATLRAIRAKNRTVARREREASRLRKLVQRQRVTSGHGYQPAVAFRGRSSDSSLIGKENDPMEKLIKRTTTVETFSTEPADELHASADLDDRDEVDVDDDADEDDSAARRRRR